MLTSVTNIVVTLVAIAVIDKLSRRRLLLRRRGLRGKRDGHNAQRHGQAFVPPEETGTQFRLRFVVPDENAYNQYYNEISNPLLWFLQHYLWDTPLAPDITHETWDAWRN